MNVTEVMNTAKDAITVKRVYGEPYEADGVTVIPAAIVGGGFGGGTGSDKDGQEGEGGGFGIGARPAGAYVIKDAQASWQPAVDPNRMATMAGLVVITYLLTRSRVARARIRAAAHG